MIYQPRPPAATHGGTRPPTRQGEMASAEASRPSARSGRCLTATARLDVVLRRRPQHFHRLAMRAALTDIWNPPRSISLPPPGPSTNAAPTVSLTTPAPGWCPVPLDVGPWPGRDTVEIAISWLLQGG